MHILISWRPFNNIHFLIFTKDSNKVGSIYPKRRSCRYNHFREFLCKTERENRRNILAGKVHCGRVERGVKKTCWYGNNIISENEFETRKYRKKKGIGNSEYDLYMGGLLYLDLIICLGWANILESVRIFVYIEIFFRPFLFLGSFRKFFVISCVN